MFVVNLFALLRHSVVHSCAWRREFVCMYLSFFEQIAVLEQPWNFLCNCTMRLWPLSSQRQNWLYTLATKWNLRFLFCVCLSIRKLLCPCESVTKPHVFNVECVPACKHKLKFYLSKLTKMNKAYQNLRFWHLMEKKLTDHLINVET